MRASTLISVMGMLVIVTALCVEGIRSIHTRAELHHRIQHLEKTQDELLDKQNYLFELITDLNQSALANTSAIRVERTSRTVNYEDLDLFCLAKNIFHEAGIETELGMFAVAQVTLNRVRNARYPDSICDVVMQPAQFSWTNDRNRR
jgi:spore germination cell wall hydrolase CwlJ-like protein